MSNRSVDELVGSISATAVLRSALDIVTVARTSTRVRQARESRRRARGWRRPPHRSCV